VSACETSSPRKHSRVWLYAQLFRESIDPSAPGDPRQAGNTLTPQTFNAAIFSAAAGCSVRRWAYLARQLWNQPKRRQKSTTHRGGILPTPFLAASSAASGVSRTTNLAGRDAHPQAAIRARRWTRNYFTRVRRRWISNTSTITNRTPATTRIIMTLSMRSPLFLGDLMNSLRSRAEHHRHSPRSRRIFRSASASCRTVRGYTRPAQSVNGRRSSDRKIAARLRSSCVPLPWNRRGRQRSSHHTTPPARGRSLDLLDLSAAPLNQHCQYDHKQHAGNNPDHCDTIHFPFSLLSI
jgi:hypothetical protein